MGRRAGTREACERVGVLVVGHGRFAAEMVETLREVVGDIEGIEGITYRADAEPEEIREAIRDAIDRVDTGAGVVVFTDLLGNTTCNMSLQIARGRGGIEVVAGVNMPMLIKLTTARDEQKSAAELADFLHRYGQEHIVWPTEGRVQGARAGG